MDRLLFNAVSAILFFGTLFLAVVLLLSSAVYSTLDLTSIAGAAVVLALLFIGIQLYGIVDKKPSGQSL